jgi:hypothetical protein
VPAAGQAREATVTQQAVTVLVPEHLAPASEKPAEPGAGRMRRWGTLARSQMIAGRAAP